MEQVFIYLAISIFATARGAQMNVTKLKYLSEDSVKTLSTKDFADESFFSLQIQETGSATETAAAAGNNLTVVGTAAPPLDQAYLQNFPQETENRLLVNKNKKHEALQKGTIKSLSSFYSEETKKRLSNAETNNEPNEELTLINNCLGSLLLNNLEILNQRKGDVETFTENTYVNNINRKRDTNENNLLLLQKLTELNQEIKNEERKQHQADINGNRKTLATITDLTTIPEISSEDFNRPTEGFNVTFFTVTKNVRERSNTEEAWFETKDKTKIRFSKLPLRESYLIPTLKLDDGFYPFGFMSEFFTLIYPFEFPVGLVKDIIWGQVTFPFSFLKSIKVESTFLLFVVIFSCIALTIPAYLICLGCMALLNCDDDEDIESGALFPEKIQDCGDRMHLAVMLIILLICGACIAGMSVSSEQATEAVSSSQSAVHAACSDLARWLTSAARELYHSIVPPVDLVVQTYRDDLRYVESLLGQPIQKAISSESGIDLVLESLNDIVEESEDLSNKISALRDVTVRGGSLASIASDRLKDLSRQLDNVKKHCTGKEIPLCDTINTNSLDLRIKFNLILHEQKLLELRTLGVENLTRAVTNARQEFQALPDVIASQTAATREEILKQIELKRDEIIRSSRILSDIVRHLTLSIRTVGKRFELMLQRLQNYDFWRWISMTGCIVACGFAMFLILFAMISGCGSAKNYAKVTLQMSSVWICISSLMLWVLLSTTFLIAGHAEVYVCQPLWDKPQYRTLTALLDRPSPLSANNGGALDAVLQDLDNITLDVSIRDVLRECEQDHPAYNVFKLDSILDVNKASSYYEWVEFHKSLKTLGTVINVNVLKTVSKELNRVLHQMLIISDVNIAQYRVEYNGPLVGKDLPALVDQLENIGAQVTDLTTSSRLETLASRTQRLQVTSIKPLDHLRADIVYKLTELELQMLPFRKKLNISLSHIHTAQYYIDNQGDIIAQKKVAQYTSRLVSHVASWRSHVINTTSTQAAKCGPLFDVYSAIRTLLCSHYIASLHCWWVCAFLLGCLWCFTVPLCVTLWRRYGMKLKELDITLANIVNIHHDSTPTTLCDTSNWNTPGPPPPDPNNDGW